jgi:hypothetical protein
MYLAPPSPGIPEQHKRAGLCYATTDEGLELPIIDIGHPAFRLEPGEAELASLMEAALGDLRKREASPAWVQRLLLRLLLRGSLLAGAVGGARGGFVTGLGTYLLKLGPGNLGQGYAKPVDSRIASSFPCLSARLRLRDTAQLLARALAPALEARPGAGLCIIDIAGGPSITVLNALMILRRGHPGLLEGRAIVVHVLDADAAGPAFGIRALAALMAEASPLHGLDLSMEARRYDWADTRPLAELLEGLAAGSRALGGGPLVAAISEGGLFDYGGDGDIAANLACLAAAQEVSLCLGTASRADGAAGAINKASGARLFLRTMEAMTALASASGWAMGACVDSPLSSSFLLARKPSPCPGPARG